MNSSNNLLAEVVHRVDRDTACALVAHVSPEYLEILSECKSPVTWAKLARKFGELAERLKIKNYVLLYEDEKRIHSALINALLSKDEQESAVSRYPAASQAEQREMLYELARPGGAAEQFAEDLFPDTPEEEQEHLAAFNSLSVVEQTEAVRRGQFLVGFFFAYLHQVLAVMVHGQKMTSLVRKAIAGVDTLSGQDAFLKAIHIDKTLILEHPRFREIHENALANGDQVFLEKIARRLGSPVTQGRIRLGGIFLVFALLESMDWLDDLSHKEILRITDEAGFDRWENRVEDETAVSKALSKYRRYQKTGGLSMH